MIQKTHGIVLSHIPYGETSIIARIYTREFGYQGFIVNSVRSAKSRKRLGFFEPFTLLDLVVYMKSTRDLQRVSEFYGLNIHQNLNISKQTVLLFLAEVMDKLLRNDHTENQRLYEFITSYLEVFYTSEFLPNFHVHFLLHLTPHLGLSAISGQELFSNMNRISGHQDIEDFIEKLIHTEIQETIAASGELRTQALETLVQYFQHHLDGFGKVNSLKVLSQIFR